jgi:LacI family transcriptional regulator
MSVTITDVARKAGVAIGTVSRVINGHSAVNPKLRERVERVIQQLGYRPNARAQSLCRKSSTVISYVLSNRDLLHPFHARVLQGVTEYCEDFGYSVLYTPLRYLPETPPESIALPPVLRSKGVADCLILGGTNYPNLLELLRRLGAHHVLLENNFIDGEGIHKPLDQVHFDEVRGAYEATKYLIGLGHKDIWYMGDISLPWYRRRFEGYLKAMDEAKLDPRAQTAGLADDRYTNGFRSAEMILDQGFPVTAIFAGTNDMAHGAWEALNRRGLDVPKDISLAGFDDFRGPARSTELTSIHVDAHETGRQLAKMALEKIKTPERAFREVLIPTWLCKGGTSRPILKEIFRPQPPTRVRKTRRA